MKYMVFMPIFLFIDTQYASACMPHSQNDVFIARYLSIENKMADPVKFDIDFTEQKFIFRSFYQWFAMGHPEIMYSEFEPQELNPNDLVIGLAYAVDGRKPELYTLSALAQLNCKDDQLFIGKTLGSFLAWDRKENQCKLSTTNHIGILDGFLNGDQSDYLKQLQNRYPTCKALEAAFPKLNSPQNDLSIFQKIYRWLLKWL
ncbi:hypothetical protein [Acinetobacter shaoyimingii]|uniref:Uncharacterized protein n=1 Tax=Acinetobacter shaoyimingii TaxID=2715164 RepID=A0A6G8RWA0_9GAMM|nr:hypothetical protein [Acinetobacter shaoyimingii]QIO06157.1 hypothetical protein G8E00_09415 [Acinetobacter shaoyimingii]